MLRSLLAAILVAIPASTAADDPPCPLDTVVAGTELAAGNRLYMAAHTTKGWFLLMFGSPTGDSWRVYAVNHRHEACISAEGDHLEIVRR